jgi:hypothetical protein
MFYLVKENENLVSVRSHKTACALYSVKPIEFYFIILIPRRFFHVPTNCLRPWALNGSHRPPTEFYRTYMDKNFDTFISRFGEMLPGFVFPHFSTPSGGEKINEFSTAI